MRYGTRFLHDGVFCLDYLDPRMYSFSRDDDDADDDTPQLYHRFTVAPLMRSM
ncbi:hypothetical protein PX979_003021 [Escherichia coli]|nr:hypothetical protein [Escherichia coli]EKP6503794.1 hypothetical protein [Escherichia coli]EKQ3776899.1 hypothetical protein [Escherichia coli]HAX1590831.1 hypothetical protein [Escherichia coli]HAX1724760.1 hypothetical protein [Escherichia coli]